jgi:CubicO group peptidase (beta-lactamase class C family)
MTDVLEMAEEYGMGADVPTMLFTSEGSDAGRFASMRRRRQLHASRGGGNFGWLYSSGLTNVLAAEFRRLFRSTHEYYDFVLNKFLGRIGKSFSFETDASGTFIASSFVYATARDLGRLAQALLEHHAGTAAREIWPRGFLDRLQVPHPESGGLYSTAASVWLNPARVSVREYNSLLHSREHIERFRWMTQILPQDCYSLSGYQGQMVLVCPSLKLAVVRLGLTPSSSDSPSASDVEYVETAKWSKSRLLSGILERLDIST